MVVARLSENFSACSLMASAYLLISSMEAPSAGGGKAMLDAERLSEVASSKLSSCSEVEAEGAGDVSVEEAKKAGGPPGLRRLLGEVARPTPRGRDGSSRC